MSPKKSIEIAKYVKDFLVWIDTKNNLIYINNFDLYKKEIDTIISDFKKYKEWKKQKSFIVFHDAYDYLFDDLWIDKSKKIVFREAVLKDPDSKHMASLIDSIEKWWVKVIYKEPLFTSPSFDNLITKYNLTVWNLDADWTDPSKNWYINQLKSNIEQLKKLYE
jgi:ABC-type Zn uptake system ZnuABC Zn-binding protein ZnuA